jgi:hypothetical protein
MRFLNMASAHVSNIRIGSYVYSSLGLPCDFRSLYDVGSLYQDGSLYEMLPSASNGGSRGPPQEGHRRRNPQAEMISPKGLDVTLHQITLRIY